MWHCLIKLCPLVVKGIINGPFACLVLQQYNEPSVIIWQHFKITRRRRRRKRSVRKVLHCWRTHERDWRQENETCNLKYSDWLEEGRRKDDWTTAIKHQVLHVGSDVKVSTSSRTAGRAERWVNTELPYWPYA